MLLKALPDASRDITSESRITQLWSRGWMSSRIRCASGTRVENECPPMCISGTTQCAGSADNAAGSYLGSTLLTRTSNASQLFRVALTYTQYFASQLFRVSTLLNIHAGNARAYTVWPYISNCPTLHPMFWKGARDTKKLLGLTSYTYMCVCFTLHSSFKRVRMCVFVEIILGFHASVAE